tara:strand:- start:1473 stop:2255 length:783 start_codon:yes stop_codon:yes gene_type:complete
MVALIDLDSILYTSVYKVVSIGAMKRAIKEHGKELAKEWLLSEVYNEGINRCENELLKMQEYLQSIFLEEITSYELFITTCSKSFRKEISQDYKVKRKRNKYVWTLRDHYKFNNAAYSDTHEADDLIYQRAKELGENNYIVVSIDKDLKQIGGYYWSYYKTPERNMDGSIILNEYGNKAMMFKQTSVEHISKKDAEGFFWKQMLMGDSVDGIKALKRVGEKTAEKILKDSKCKWFTVAREYIKRDQKKDFYLTYNLLKLV